jgi:hypothetical protein
VVADHVPDLEGGIEGESAAEHGEEPLDEEHLWFDVEVVEVLGHLGQAVP